MAQFNDSASLVPITIFGPQGEMAFFPTGTLTSSFTPAEIISAIKETASFVFEFTTESNALQIRIPATSSGQDSDIIPIHITSSGQNPRVGIGTDNPLTVFDFKDINESATGTELILRSSRTSSGAEIGDSAGRLAFIIDSASYTDLKKTGSVAEIDATVDDIDEFGVRGTLNLKVAPAKSSSPVNMLRLKDNYAHELTGSLNMPYGNNSSGILTASKIYVSSSNHSYISELSIGGSGETPLGSRIFSVSGDAAFTGDVLLGNSSLDEIDIRGSVTSSADISSSGEIFGLTGSFDVIQGGTF